MNSPLEWLTLALVVITFYYAVQTHRTVREMRKAREAALRPHLVPVFEPAGPPRERGNIYVMNVGEGAALDIDVTLHLAPDGMRSRLQTPMIKSGERRIWNPTLDGSSGNPDHPFYLDAAPGRTRLHLVGRCRDVARVWHTIDESTALRDGWHVILDLEGA